MTLEFPAGTRFVQIHAAAIAVTPDEQVYRVANGRALRLVPVHAEPIDLAEVDADAPGVPVAQHGDGS